MQEKKKEEEIRKCWREISSEKRGERQAAVNLSFSFRTPSTSSSGIKSLTVETRTRIHVRETPARSYQRLQTISSSILLLHQSMASFLEHMLVPQVKEVSQEDETSNIPFAWITWHREVTARHETALTRQQPTSLSRFPDFFVTFRILSSVNRQRWWTEIPWAICDLDLWSFGCFTENIFCITNEIS